MDQISDKQKLIQFLRSASIDELGYMLGRYCGPHNVLLAEKKYGRSLAKELQRLLNEEIAYRQLDDLLAEP